MEAALKKQIIDVLIELNPKEIAVFGSYARGEQREDSDIDILIEYHEAPNFFQIVQVIRKLEDLVLLKVDLVDADGVSDRFLNAVKLESKIIFSNVQKSA
jgi:hypothetical protein